MISGGSFISSYLEFPIVQFFCTSHNFLIAVCYDLDGYWPGLFWTTLFVLILFVECMDFRVAECWYR